MIFENNYIWPGTTAIIYSVILDYDFLGFYTTELKNNTTKDNVVLPQDSQLEEIGLEWKKTSDNEWTQLLILNSDDLQKVKDGLISAEHATNLAKTDHIDLNKYVISSPVGIYETNFIFPIYIVIKELDQLTSYTVRSYYIKSGVKNYYNLCTTTTFERKDIYYECNEVTGGTDYQNDYLKNKLNEGCYIYNAMTNFCTSTTPSDNLGSKTGGKFKGTYDPNLANAAAHSGMVFKSYAPGISTVCHEMAHNLMKNQIDERENEEAHDKIVKFMEFATHSSKATWRWQSGHNYPVISSASYSDALNYLVAAACRVCRDASGLL